MATKDDTAILQDISRLGLMAFEGQFPFLLAEAAAQLSIPVTAFAVKGITSDKLAEQVDTIHWMKLGQFTKCIEQLHKENIGHIVMAGRVAHNSIWKYRGFDTRTLRILGGLVNRKADTLLGAVVDEFENENITVLDSSLLIRNCLAPAGLLTPRHALSDRQRKDLEFGMPLAREIAGLDIGQTIVVKDLAVVAVESLEGTDETILRGGRIADGDIVVIKVAKPTQDNRFDIPVIGPTTIHNLHQAGGGALCIMADRTLFFDREESLKYADSVGISVYSVPEN